MIGETAQLVVQLTLKDQLSGGVSKAERSLTGLNATTKAGVGHMSVLSVAAGKVSRNMVGFGGAMSHAAGKVGGLLTGPLGLIGLTGGILGLGGAIVSSLRKIEDFGLGLEKVQTLTGEMAQQSGALILLFEKYGLGVDRVSQIAGFAAKTPGKLNATTAKGATATKSATLQNLELVKAQRQAAGESTKAINKLISEQKGRDAITAAQAKGAAGVTKLAALDKQYGLQLIDSKGKVVDFSTELEQLAKFYDSNASASTKAYVAAQVLGRGYTAAIPILKGGSAALRAAAEESKQLGLDQAGTVEKLAKLRDATRDLGAQFNVLQLQIGLALVPALTDAAKAFSSWLSSGGSQQIVDFFKSGAVFAQQMGHAIETFIVPGFKAISAAWGAIPGPLKDLLITGFVLNKAGKFLFDKSLFSGIGQVTGGVLQRGGTPANPLFVSDVAGGLGKGAGVAAAGGLGIASKVFLVGEAIGLAVLVNDVRQGIADGNTKTSQALQTQTQTWLATQPSKADLAKGLAGVEKGIADLQTSNLPLFLVQGDALDNLKKMRVEIKQQLAEANGQRLTGNLGRPGPMGLVVSPLAKIASTMTAVQQERQKSTDEKLEKVLIQIGTALQQPQTPLPQRRP